MRIEDIDPNTIFEEIEKLIDEHAIAKAARIYMEESRKITKALEMQIAEQEGIKSSVAYEKMAYASDAYRAIVDGLKAAVIKEEKARWKLNTEMMKIEVWRSLNADKRAASK